MLYSISSEIIKRKNLQGIEWSNFKRWNKSLFKKKACDIAFIFHRRCMLYDLELLTCYGNLQIERISWTLYYIHLLSKMAKNYKSYGTKRPSTRRLARYYLLSFKIKLDELIRDLRQRRMFERVRGGMLQLLVIFI